MPSRRGALAFGFGWGIAPLAAGSQGLDLARLRIGTGLDDSSKPVLYAQDAGLFRRAGLDVEIVALNGGGAAIAAAVAGGSLEIGKSNTLQLISAHEHGLPFTLIAPSSANGAYERDAAIVVRSGAPIRSARDLNGKTVGVTSLVTIQLLSTRAWIDANGGDSQSVRFLEVSPAATQAALDQGRIDAATVLDPILSQIMAAGSLRVLAYPYGAVATRFDGSDFFTTTDWAAKHRDLVERFVRVMHDANAYVSAHETETNPVLAAFAKIDLAVLEHMNHIERPAYLDGGQIQPLIDQAARYKFITKPFTAAELISDYALKRPR